jgi:hypothetical protein
MTVERDVLGRLEWLGLAHYVTGSWALGVYAEPRMTRDIGIVASIDHATYETAIRPKAGSVEFSRGARHRRPATH